MEYTYFGVLKKADVWIETAGKAGLLLGNSVFLHWKWPSEVGLYEGRNSLIINGLRNAIFWPKSSTCKKKFQTCQFQKLLVIYFQMIVNKKFSFIDF